LVLVAGRLSTVGNSSTATGSINSGVRASDLNAGGLRIVLNVQPGFAVALSTVLNGFGCRNGVHVVLTIGDSSNVGGASGTCQELGGDIGQTITVVASVTGGTIFNATLAMGGSGAITLSSHGVANEA